MNASGKLLPFTRATGQEAHLTFRWTLLLGLALAFLQATASTFAQTPSLTFDDGRQIGTVGNVDYGFEFTVNQSFTIGSLGVFDLGLDGLVESHLVGLFATSGTLLASTTVPAGTAAPLINQFRYSAITPLTLAAGLNYRIGVYYPDGNEPLLDYASNLVVDPRLTIVGGRWGRFGFHDPSADNTALHVPCIFGPNMLIVPEPATISLLVLGALALSCRRTK
jgi:hypothetical protein